MLSRLPECARSVGYQVKAIDTTGTRECFAVAFILAMLRGDTLTAVAEFANAAALDATDGARTGVPIMLAGNRVPMPAT
jgi:sugar/nucleoside kinase (ribokinase family)